jgi:biopolymer transport protein ExbD
MTQRDPWDEPADEEGDFQVVLRRPVRDSGDLDITPMIDITFLLLIFFLVASVPDYQTAVALPMARYGTGVSDKACVIFSVFDSKDKGPAEVYLGDGRKGDKLSADAATQEQEIRQAVDQGLAEGRLNVLIKAERTARHREVSRVAAIAGRIDGVKGLFLAVKEGD